MKCVILAAGYATRLYPLTKNYPKPLLKVGGRPILDWLIEDVADLTDEFRVVSNHRFSAIFEDWRGTRKENIVVVDDGTETNETRLGAVRDIHLAAVGVDDDLLVMAGDNLLDFSLKGFVAFAAARGASCVMCHEENRLAALQKTAVISVDGDGRITSYEEKPRAPKGNLAVPPFYYYRRGDAGRIPEALADGCASDAPGSFAAWLSRRTPMYAYRMPGKRYDIGDLASFERVKAIFEGNEGCAGAAREN